jgi:hypothetical protein
MMAYGTVAPLPASSSSAVQRTTPALQRHVELVEAKAFAQLGGNEERDARRWILDTGATNHMTGARTTFSDLDVSIRGTVKFGDGSLVEIEGRGTIILDCKNGEQRALTGVYLIPRLTANILSLGQLEKSGHRIEIGGGCLRIFDAQEKLLARVPRTDSCLYVLEVQVGQPVCLAARSTEVA